MSRFKFMHGAENSPEQTATTIDPTRRLICKTTLASSMMFALPAIASDGLLAEKQCLRISPEQAFASSFLNVQDEYGPTIVKFDNPLPVGLSGTLYRNGPARMQRGDTRYNHWFDGDGMVHAFSLEQQHMTHRAKMVTTERSIIEDAAGRYLRGGFGTAFADSQRVNGPDDLNVANTSVLPVGNEVLALWEAGSPYRMHAETLETIGRLVLSPETDGLPFSAHPRVDPHGRIWNFGDLSGTGKIALYDMNPNGSLNRTAVIEAPNADMVHDFAITEQYLVFVLLPLRANPIDDPAMSFRDSLHWDATGAVEVVVVEKQSLTIAHQFQLPSFFAFHLGNAWQDGNSIRIEVAAAADFDPLMNAIEFATRGQRTSNDITAGKAMDIRLDLVHKTATMEPLPTRGAEFPRYDQRFTGQATDKLFMLSGSDDLPEGVFGFNTVTALNRKDDSEAHFSYGSNALAEEHIFVPAAGKASGTGWLVGTSYNWKKCRSTLSVFDAAHIDDGPIAQAELPYSLPMGLHGEFVAT